MYLFIFGLIDQYLDPGNLTKNECLKYQVSTSPFLLCGVQCYATHTAIMKTFFMKNENDGR